ncbi:MAG TPA: hypothetical protein EYH34_18650, partial [Planctomycetes bacterium]|nr:hypothetical protein [Planctomycetota bacterium]
RPHRPPAHHGPHHGPTGHAAGPPFHRPPGPPRAGWGPHRRPPAPPWARPRWAPPRVGRRPPVPGDPKAIFERLDRDRDGKLSLEEFTAGMRAFHRRMGRPVSPVSLGRPVARPRPATFLLALLKRADSNHDGKLTLDEVPAERREGFKKILQRADRDGDGALSVQEARRASVQLAARARWSAAARRPQAQAHAAKKPAESKPKGASTRKAEEKKSPQVKRKPHKPKQRAAKKKPARSGGKPTKEDKDR